MIPDPPRARVARRVIRSAAGAAAVLFAAATPATAQPVSPARAAPAAPAPAAFCIPGVDTLDEDACYVAPANASRTLLIYLHGILPPDETSRIKTNFETVVKNGALRAGVVALLPRGKQGIAPPGHDRWWAWPTTGSGYDRHGAELAAKISAKRAKLEELLQRRFDRVYLAGSSSGAYFVAALALRGGVVADGYAALSGGAPFWAPKLAALSPRPFYIGYGLWDTVRGSCTLLASQLRRAAWPVRVSEFERTGHGARDEYLDEAFAFWASAAAR